MSDDPRVNQLLDELVDTSCTPEEICVEFPELLTEVRDRLQQMRLVQAELDALFPRSGESLPSSSQESSTLPQIPGYEVETILGSGGMGVVFRARHMHLNRMVALKMALAGAYAGQHERERFQREAEAVASLRHPNIVQVYDVGESAGRPYFTMEFVESGSLAEKLQGTPLPAREAAAILATLAGAIHVAHEGGIVHRDLKPANIMLTSEGNPKITDFGLARRLGGEAGLTRTGLALGTPSYMAPEQARGKTDAQGAAVDIYALGAILYELLTGRPPFRAETASETVHQLLTQEPVPPSRLNGKVPRDLETVCLQCLQKEPQRRYTSSAALADDLTRYLLGQVVVARPVGQLERAGKWIQRNKWVAGLSAVAVFLLVAGTVASLLFALEAKRNEELATNRASDLETRTIELENQKRESERVLISGLLFPIGRNPPQLLLPQLLDPAETDALCQLRAIREEIRLQFLEAALRDPEQAKRIRRRAYWVVQAIVGCNRDLRAKVGQLLAERIQEPEVPQETVLACAQLGTALNLDDRGWGERSAQALTVALCDPQFERFDVPTLAESLAAACEHLPKSQATQFAGRVIVALLERLKEPIGIAIGHNFFGPAIVVLSPYLDAAEAQRTAETLGDLIRKSVIGSNAWPELAKAQAAACQRLHPSDASRHLNRTVDFVVATRRTTNDRDKGCFTFYAQALGVLCKQFDAAIAARAAETITDMLADGYSLGATRSEFITNSFIPQELAKVAERLDAAGSLRASQALISLLKRGDNISSNMEPLNTALLALCRRVNDAGSVQVAETALTAFRDSKTSVLARVLLSNAIMGVEDKLDPDKAAEFNSAIADTLMTDLANPTFPYARGFQGQALATLSGRRGAPKPARTAEALTLAISNQQTSLSLLKPLAAALANVCSHMDATEASSVAKKAVDVLDAMWAAKTRSIERASLAEAMTAIWKLLSPHEAVPLARRVVVHLKDAFRDPKAEAHELKQFAEAVVAACGHLDSAERVEHANCSADILIAKIQRRDRIKLSELVAGALVVLSEHLNADGLTRVADMLFALLSDVDIQRYRSPIFGNMFRRIAIRMDDRALERFLDHPSTSLSLQRIILDVLGESKRCHFRTTWDYLEWTKAN